MITRIITIFLVLFGLLSPALAQKTKSIMSTELSTQLPDNTSGAITPSILRTVLGDMVNSWQQYGGVNAQTGVTYTFQASDYGQLVTFNNGGAVAVTLPQATGSFQYFSVYAVNNGVGTVTITPTTSTIDGASSLTLLTGQGVFIVSDQANYQIFKPRVFVSSGTAADNTFLAGNQTWTPSFNTRNVAGRFGSMDVWQRGAGATAAISITGANTAYSVDGCYLNTGTNQVSVVSATNGIAAGSWKAAGIVRVAGQAGSPTGTTTFGCPLDTEEIGLYAGQFVTLSFTVSTGANWSPTSGNLTYGLVCGTGNPKKYTTGYTNFTNVMSATNALGAGASAQRLQITSSAVVPATCTQSEIVFAWVPTGTAGNADLFTLDDIQLEVVPSAASVASNFEREGFTTRLLRAQRHYTKTFAYGTAPAQSVSILNQSSLFTRNFQLISPSFIWRLPVPMRTTPTITTFNPAASNANCRNIAGAGSDQTVIVDPGVQGPSEVLIFCTGGGTNSDQLYINAQADAGI